MKYFLLLLSFVTSIANAQLTYHWRQYSGPVTAHIQNPDSATTNATGLDQVGIYGFEFTVSCHGTDSLGNDIILTGKDSMTVTVISGSLGIEHDSVYHPIRRPKVTKLEIRTAVNGDLIYLYIKSPRVQNIECGIYDVAGRKLAKADLFLKEGDNFMTLPKPRISGIYFLRFITYLDNPVTKKIFF